MLLINFFLSLFYNPHYVTFKHLPFAQSSQIQYNIQQRNIARQIQPEPLEALIDSAWQQQVEARAQVAGPVAYVLIDFPRKAYWKQCDRFTNKVSYTFYDLNPDAFPNVWQYVKPVLVNQVQQRVRYAPVVWNRILEGHPDKFYQSLGDSMAHTFATYATVFDEWPTTATPQLLDVMSRVSNRILKGLEHAVIREDRLTTLTPLEAKALREVIPGPGLRWATGMVDLTTFKALPPLAPMELAHPERARVVLPEKLLRKCNGIVTKNFKRGKDGSFTVTVNRTFQWAEEIRAAEDRLFLEPSAYSACVNSPEVKARVAYASPNLPEVPAEVLRGLLMLKVIASIIVLGILLRDKGK